MNSGVDLSAANAMIRQQAMAMLQQHNAANESTQVATLCAQIVCNRDKMLGQYNSEVSIGILEEAERILLTWLTSLQPKEPQQGAQS